MRVILGSLESRGEYSYGDDIVVMLRNLYIRKGLPFTPMRSCRKKTGPSESSFIKSAKVRKRGPATRIKARAATKSKIFFANSYPKRAVGLPNDARRIPSISR